MLIGQIPVVSLSVRYFSRFLSSTVLVPHSSSSPSSRTPTTLNTTITTISSHSMLSQSAPEAIVDMTSHVAKKLKTTTKVDDKDAFLAIFPTLIDDVFATLPKNMPEDGKEWLRKVSYCSLHPRFSSHH